MIAKVRIAPMERWCPSYRKYLAQGTPHRLVGLEVEIETDGMELVTQDGMHGAAVPFRVWPLTQKSIELLNREVSAIGSAPEKIMLCEHMLEMD